VVAQRTVVAYFFGMLQNEHYGPLQGAGTAAMAAQERFPLLAETASTAKEVGSEFHKGLEVVLRGLSHPSR
jgi:hypothetical protein